MLTFTNNVKGAGSTTGNIHYAGSYSPGNSPAAVSAENIFMDPTSTLIMEIAGTGAGSQYDQLNISGTANLAGTLDIEVLNGFVPTAGQTFNLFNGALQGDFSNFIVTGQDPLLFDFSQLHTTGIVSVAPSTSGTWTNSASGGMGNDHGNWLNGTIAAGQDATAYFNSLDLTADNTIHLNTPRRLGNLVFGDAAPSNNWILDNNGNNNNTLTLTVSTGTPTITVDNQTATISARVAGTNGLAKLGSGRLLLSGNNTYSGGTTVNDGTLIVGHANGLGTGGLTVNGTALHSCKPA